MISSKQWRRDWSPMIPGREPTVYRVELLNDMWALYDWCKRTYNKLESDELMLKVIRHGVLNRSQVAKLACRTRQATTQWCAGRDLGSSLDNPAAAGSFDPEQLIYLIHLTTKLAQKQPISSNEIALLKRCGSLTLMSVLVGAPIGTIRRAMKGMSV